MTEIEATLTLRLRKPAPRVSGRGDFVVYYVPAIRKVGCSVRLDARLQEQGIEESAVRVLEVVPKGCGPKVAADRERWWCELLGCDVGTRYDAMLERRRRRRR
jgi:hypothetical protein